MEKSSRISLRVTPAEKEAWEAAANGSVSTWLRNLANRSAESTRCTRAGIDPDPIFREKPGPKTVPACPRWMHHRPGVYCGSCGG